MRPAYAGRLGRETRAALGAAALEDHPPGLRGHAGAEAVLALTATNVGLVGALHEKRLRTEKFPQAGGQRSVSIDDGRPPTSPQARRAQRCAAREFPPPLSTAVEGMGCRSKYLQISLFWV